MSLWRVRDFHESDLDAAIRMWDDPACCGAAPVAGLTELLAAVRRGEPTVVAVVGEELVGAVVATVSGDQAWLLRISLAPGWRQRGVGSALLEEVERRLRAAGVQRVRALLADETDAGAAALRNRGFSSRSGVHVFDKSAPAAGDDVGVLGQLGGRTVTADAWERIGGMVREKELIERRVVLPLAEPELAAQHGLEPPRGILLFGPPGTGKTTFVKGIAGRLGWPFVELFPSRLAGESPAGLAAALREAFTLVAELEAVVVFIDEVEEIAARREIGAAPGLVGVTNEMLKLIPTFRERDDRLLVCATNSVRALDSAFLRHGRFDYLIPVGPPDDSARGAIWNGYLGTIPHEQIDLATVVEASHLFTPADIEYAARRTAQAVFERAVVEGVASTATTQDVLHGIAETRPTLTDELITWFEEDIAAHARV